MGDRSPINRSSPKKKSSEQARLRRNDTSASQYPKQAHYRNDTPAPKKYSEQARRRNDTSTTQYPEPARRKPDTSITQYHEPVRRKPDTSAAAAAAALAVLQNLKIIEKLSLVRNPILYSELDLEKIKSIQNKKSPIKSLQLKTYLFHTLFYSISILFRGARALSRKSIFEDYFSEIINKISKYLKELNNEYYNLCLNNDYKKFITSKSIQKMYAIAIDTNDDILKTKIIQKIKERKIIATEISNAKILRILSKSTGTIIFGLTALAAIVSFMSVFGAVGFTAPQGDVIIHRAKIIEKYLNLIDLENINYEINLKERYVIYELINTILKINKEEITGFHNIKDIHPVILEWQNALQTNQEIPDNLIRIVASITAPFTGYTDGF